MRAIRVTPVALLGAAALALTAPAVTAHAAIAGGPSDPGSGYTVTPSVVAPGGQVTLAARACSTTATATSGVFDTVTIPRGGTGRATVDSDAKPGAVYQVTFTCNTSPSSTAHVNLTISAATSTPTTSSTSSAVSTASPAGVQGGLGGSIDSMNSGEIVAGTALAVAAAAGTVFVVRRRKESRSH
ncbi:hypothetical protein E6R60_07670 [Streptomyces sp. A0642]|uniref:hypothetical protein n=1 Tax=Streptomyces sp. A0642 TaxID=2563100 RepID=UPI0010A27713|nr:hypothetical protein [Streptomyces sp. A0642]THA77436.1 hypothetical protein E6R60_07670 [Streptomyces sp. A0642]